MRGGAVRIRLAAGIAVGLATVGLAAAPAAPAAAQEPPGLTEWSGDTGVEASATATASEDVETTVTVFDDLAIHSDGPNRAPFGAPEAEMFAEPVPVDDGWLALTALDEDCDEGDTCHRGTMTIEFSQPVVDPVIHLSGIGSQTTGALPAGTVELSLIDSEPAEATVGDPLPGAANLTVTNPIQAGSPQTALAFCAGGAGCGSLPVFGVASLLIFEVSLLNVATSGPDSFSLLVSITELAGPAPIPAADPASNPLDPASNTWDPASDPSNPNTSPWNPPIQLANTGPPVAGLVGLGLAALVVGSAAIVVARTRRRER